MNEVAKETNQLMFWGSYHSFTTCVPTCVSESQQMADEKEKYINCILFTILFMSVLNKLDVTK